MINTRTNTVPVRVGNLVIGNSNKIIIQSMTNTKTANIKETIRQIKKMAKNNCELVRIAIFDVDDANAIKKICKLSPIPIVADIHFNPDFAIKAIKDGVAKIRINPGNISNKNKLKEIITLAKKKNVAIRIGFNDGSLPKNVDRNDLSKKTEKIISEIKKYLNFFEKLNFHEIIISFKSSDPLFTKSVNKMIAKEFKYPIHLGVTEAGLYEDAIIKSTIGIFELLKDEKIGNTIRISITGDPIKEISVAKKILFNANLYTNLPKIIACPTCGRTQWKLNKYASKIEKILFRFNKNISVAIMGCIVNGYGESKKVDIGIVGIKKHQVMLFISGKKYKNIKQWNLIKEFKKILFNFF